MEITLDPFQEITELNELLVATYSVAAEAVKYKDMDSRDNMMELAYQLGKRKDVLCRNLVSSTRHR